MGISFLHCLVVHFSLFRNRMMSSYIQHTGKSEILFFSLCTNIYMYTGSRYKYKMNMTSVAIKHNICYVSTFIGEKKKGKTHIGQKQIRAVCNQMGVQIRKKQCTQLSMTSKATKH